MITNDYFIQFTPVTFFIFSERTEKLPMSSIRNVISEPIEGSEEYHILVNTVFPNHRTIEI